MKASYESADLAGKRVLVREDLNAPLKDGRVADDSRLKAAIPTLKDLSERGARVIIASHLGRPNGKREPALSLQPVAERLAKLIGKEVAFADDCVGGSAEAAAARLQDGQLLLLENVRFHAEEEANEPRFAGALAGLAELYVNDAFAVSHRAHASVVGVAGHLPAYAGKLMLAELEALHRALDEPRRPLVAIVGGAKIASKAGVLHFLLPRVDRLLICGAMANTFLKARGMQVGASLVEDLALEEARRVDAEAGDKLLLPVDAVCAERMEAGQKTRVCAVASVEPGWMMLDLGPESVKQFGVALSGAGTIVWNGPAGVFEIPDFSEGTRLLGQAVAASGAFTLVGGGDTAAAVEALGLGGRFSHVSTGGGATLESMEGKELPGVAVLQEAA